MVNVDTHVLFSVTGALRPKEAALLKAELGRPK